MSDSNGGIGIGSIVFCIIVYNVFFGSDDKDKDVKEVVVETQDEYVLDEPKKEIKKDIKKIVTSAKKTFEEAKEKIIEERNENIKPLESMEKDKPKKEFKRL